MTFQLDRHGATASRSRSGCVAEGKAYEDEGAIRFRMPDEGVTAWDDVVRGRVEVPNEKLEDLVLVRSDGRPTYNFASPLEDVWDGITHVIRGEDHISNTPKQLNLIRAIGADVPVYAHVSHVLGADGTIALEAPRLGHRRRVPRAGVLPAGARELPRAARLELRRQDDDHVASTSSSSASRSTASCRARPSSTTRSSTG